MTANPEGTSIAINLLADLNTPQASAISHGEEPLLVVVGPGLGTTRVLTRWIAFLMAQGILPTSNLAIIFTRKAAAETRLGVSEMVGSDTSSRMWVSTFHSACARILHSHARALRRRSSFAIYGQSDARRLLEYLIRDMALDSKRFPAKAVLGSVHRPSPKTWIPRPTPMLPLECTSDKWLKSTLHTKPGSLSPTPWTPTTSC